MRGWDRHHSLGYTPLDRLILYVDFLCVDSCFYDSQLPGSRIFGLCRIIGVLSSVFAW